MAYLADTNIVLWAIDDFKKMSPVQREIIENSNEVSVSLVSVWEMAIKASIGKLIVPENITSHLIDMGFTLLNITSHHVEATRYLPLHHRDPFDRLLVVQAQIEKLTILSADKNLRLYDVPVI